MTDSNNQENKQETLNEETKKKGLSMEALKQPFLPLLYTTASLKCP